MTTDARRQNAWLAETMQSLTETERGVLTLGAAILQRLANEDGAAKP